MQKNKIRKKFGPLNIILLLILCAYVLSMFIMFGWGIITSLKSNVDYKINPLGFPSGGIANWKWDNYLITLKEYAVPLRINGKIYKVGMFRMFLNSIVYSAGLALLNSFLQCTMGYLVAKFDFKISKVIYATVIVTMVLPIVGSLPSQLQILRALHLYDNLIGVYLIKASFTGMYFLVFYAMFRGLQKEYVEAAYIDGAGNFRVYFQIVIPIVANTLLTISLMSFIAYWNDYQVSLIYMPSTPTIAYGMFYYTQSAETVSSWPPLKITGCIIMTIPILIIFIFGHKRIMGKIYTGGIKG